MTYSIWHAKNISELTPQCSVAWWACIKKVSGSTWDLRNVVCCLFCKLEHFEMMVFTLSVTLPGDICRCFCVYLILDTAGKAADLGSRRVPCVCAKQLIPVFCERAPQNCFKKKAMPCGVPLLHIHCRILIFISSTYLTTPYSGTAGYCDNATTVNMKPVINLGDCRASSSKLLSTVFGLNLVEQGQLNLTKYYQLVPSSSKASKSV